MADRIIRDELWQSTRWLDLPSDTHRLVYVSLIPIADDYGNVEGGPRRLYRWMHGFTQVKAEDDAIKVMSDLQDADLARRYEVAGKEFWHLPRFSNSRRYWSRKCPRSPFKEQAHKESKYDINQGSENNPDADLPQTYRNPRRGVGVGVGVGVGGSTRSTPLASPDKEPSGSAGVVIPLLGKKEWTVPLAFLTELETAYPSVDGPATLREIRAWCVSNPSRCKTEKGVRRFINTWFERTQNA